MQRQDYLPGGWPPDCLERRPKENSVCVSACVGSCGAFPSFITQKSGNSYKRQNVGAADGSGPNILFKNVRKPKAVEIGTSPLS